jgi:hypothetical protein
MLKKFRRIHMNSLKVQELELFSLMSDASSSSSTGRSEKKITSTAKFNHQ